MEDLKAMTVGDIVDFVIEWNDMHDFEAAESTTRKATQSDWDAFLG